MIAGSAPEKPEDVRELASMVEAGQLRAVIDQAFSLDEIWALAHLEEDWTIEHWGSDEEAEKRRALRREEAAAAAAAFSAMQA